MSTVCITDVYSEELFEKFDLEFHDVFPLALTST